VTFLSVILAAMGFIILVVLHELGHFAVAKMVGMRVEKFSLFFPPTLFSRTRGETEYAIGLIPAGGYVKITGMNPDEELPEDVRDRAYHAQKPWKRIAVILAGPGVNIVVAFVLLFSFFWLIGGETQTDRVGTIEKGYPAAMVLEPGDTLVSVDNKVGEPIVLSKQISTHKCAKADQGDGCKAATPANLVVDRDGTLLPISVRPIYDKVAKRNRIGFGYAAGPRETLSFGKAFTTSLDRFWLVTKTTVSLPARIFNAEERKQISGIVGTYEVTRQTILTNIADVVAILALISLSLAIVNLFPFLPLDGGHIFWAVVEKLRGKPVPLAVMERSGVIGFMLVIALFAIGLTNDIGRLTGEGFQVR